MLNNKSNLDWPAKGTRISFEKLCAWGIYLARCDVARKMLESKSKGNVSLPTWYKYWFPYYANLYIVIEGWQEIKFYDPRIDALIKSHPGTIQKLRRLRNAVFHYQKSMIDARFREFFESEKAIEWAYVLNNQFNQYFYEVSYKDVPGPIKNKQQVRSSIKKLLGWYPNSIDDTIEKTKLVFKRFKKRARKNDDLAVMAKDVALSAGKGIRVARQVKKDLNKLVDNLCCEMAPSTKAKSGRHLLHKGQIDPQDNKLIL